jgi:hypothetical protein
MNDEFVSFYKDTVTVNWQNIWVNHGHKLGDGLISPDNKYFFIKIPKNSSSFIVKHLSELGWYHSNFYDHKNLTSLFALRDPIERWVSGIVEYLFMYHMDCIDHLVSNPNAFDFWPILGEKLGIDLMLKHTTFDDHTEQQVVFLNGVDLNNCKPLFIDNKFNINFTKLLNELGYKVDLANAEKVNSSDSGNSTGRRKKLLKEIIQFIINRDYQRVATLRKFYDYDYGLINTINFFGETSV